MELNLVSQLLVEFRAAAHIPDPPQNGIPRRHIRLFALPAGWSEPSARIPAFHESAAFAPPESAGKTVLCDCFRRSPTPPTPTLPQAFFQAKNRASRLQYRALLRCIFDPL